MVLNNQISTYRQMVNLIKDLSDQKKHLINKLKIFNTDEEKQLRNKLQTIQNALLNIIKVKHQQTIYFLREKYIFLFLKFCRYIEYRNLQLLKIKQQKRKSLKLVLRSLIYFVHILKGERLDYLVVLGLVKR